MTVTTATELTVAEIYWIQLKNGVIARFTSHDKDIAYGGHIYQAIPIRRTQIKYHSDLQVDRVSISFGLIGIRLGPDTLTIPQIIRREYLREAHVKISLVDYKLLNADTLLFEGWVSGGIEFSGGITTLNCGSLLDRLEDNFPKYVYSMQCNHQLFSKYCGLSKSAHQTNGTVKTNTTQQFIYDTVFAFANKPAGYWNKGEFRMTSGPNAHISRTIMAHFDGHIKLLIPFPEIITVGESYSVWPGCDKTGATCHNKYNNYANFFGFEHIPAPETLAF